jgi:hypothetical protein
MSGPFDAGFHAGFATTGSTAVVTPGQISLPPAFDPILLDAMPDVVLLNRYVGDDPNGNAQYDATTITTRANIVLERSLTELRLGHGMRLQSSGMDIYIPAPVTMATVIIAANNILPKDKIAFTIEEVEYIRYVMMVTVNRDQYGLPWTESLIVQITKE